MSALRTFLSASALLTPVVLSAAVWQDDDWAVIGSYTESAGYDSNLTLSKTGSGAAFVSEQPGFVLKRYASSSKFEFAGNASATNYLNTKLGVQLDGSAQLSYAYPQSEEGDVISQFTGNAGWDRTSSGNVYVGERLNMDTETASFDGFFFSTGKLGMTGGFAFERNSYSDERLNSNQRAAVHVGLGYQPDPKLQYSINWESGLGDSDPEESTGQKVKKWDNALLLEAKGDLGPKLSGKVYAGLSVAHYTGGFSRTEIYPSTGGYVEWQATPRGEVTLGLDFSTGFSPVGDAELTRGLRLAYRQGLSDSWYWQTHIDPSDISYRRERRTRLDHMIEAGTGISYEPSKQVSIGLSYEFTHVSSDAQFASFNRHYVSLSFTYRF